MTRLTRVVHCRREPYDVLIDRTTLLGNPFVIGRDGDRGQVIAAYEAYLRQRPDLLAMLPALRGKVLGCWCAPQPCHGDVLARYADHGPAEEDWTGIVNWPAGQIRCPDHGLQQLVPASERDDCRDCAMCIREAGGS